MSGNLSPADNKLETSTLFPDSKYRKLKLSNCELRTNSAYASTIKDAGDDPDVTDKALISAVILPSSKSEITEKDHILKCDKATLILRGGDGVGIATKPGVDVPVGKWAINPVPREMIRTNLLDSGFGEEEGVWLVEISIKDGAKLAEKTLNPSLGIKGGLSILGTTGIVEPKSHAAYIKTIEIVMNGLKREEIDTVVLCTGARTLKAAQRDFPELPDFSFIRIGDFIADSLDLASSIGFKKAIISCMPGKLFKYASGHEYTHAHNVELDLNKLTPLLRKIEIPEQMIEKAVGSVTFRALLDHFSDQIKNQIIDQIGRQALQHIQKWSKTCVCEIRCYNYKNELQGAWSGKVGN